MQQIVLSPLKAKARIEKAVRLDKRTVIGKLTDEVIALRKMLGLPLSGPLGRVGKR